MNSFQIPFSTGIMGEGFVVLVSFYFIFFIYFLFFSFCFVLNFELPPTHLTISKMENPTLINPKEDFSK